MQWTRAARSGWSRVRAARGVRRNARSGFTLIEVIVALVILAVAALGIAGVAATTSRMLARASATEGAAAAAGLVMDSLLLTDEVSGGTRAFGRYRIEWSVRDAAGVRRIELIVEFAAPGGSVERRVEFGALHVRAPSLMPGTAAP